MYLTTTEKADKWLSRQSHGGKIGTELYDWLSLLQDRTVAINPTHKYNRKRWLSTMNECFRRVYAGYSRATPDFVLMLEKKGFIRLVTLNELKATGKYKVKSYKT